MPQIHAMDKRPEIERPRRVSAAPMTCCCRRWLTCSCCCRKKPDEDLLENFDDSTSTGRLLIFVNPKSGAGNGFEVFQRSLKPQLVKQRVAFESLTTLHANHAAEVVLQRRDLSNVNGIVIVSGDGLVFEVINAILRRHDASFVLRNVPILIVPCGSGNGLLSSVFFNRKLQLTPQKSLLNTSLEAVYNTKTAVSSPVNLVHVRAGDKVFAGFLSIGWGLMADIDIESESLRTVCGGQRFFFGALWKVAALKTHRARLSFLPAPEDLEATDTAVRPVYGGHRPSKDNGSERKDPWKETLVVDPPDLDAPVPHGWRVIEDEFINVYAVTLSHISATNVFAPEARLNEPQIHLCYLLKRDVKSRGQLVNFLTAIERGEHLKLPFVEYVKVSAFRLETFSHKHSRIVVDGEVLEGCEQVQAVASNLNIRVGSL